jgi:hypothetical protein
MQRDPREVEFGSQGQALGSEPFVIWLSVEIRVEMVTADAEMGR